MQHVADAISMWAFWGKIRRNCNNSTVSDFAQSFDRIVYNLFPKITPGDFWEHSWEHTPETMGLMDMGTFGFLQNMGQKYTKHI